MSSINLSRRNVLLSGASFSALALAQNYVSTANASPNYYRSIRFTEMQAMTPQQMARSSTRVTNAWKFMLEAATTIKDESIRKTVIDILMDPTPTIGQNDADAINKELRAQGLLSEKVLSAFPENNPVQPTYSAPGSGWGSHHAYPGGLVTHVALNTASAISLFNNYVKIDGMSLDYDVVVASQLLHDLHKPWVFQWKEDGSLRTEQSLAGTGQHHVLSGAESFKKGLSADLVVAQLCAHEPPMNANSEKMVVDWLKACAIINGKKANEVELLANDNRTLPLPRRIEGFITHLADHDWIISVPACQWVVSALKQVAQESYALTEADLKAKPFNQLRNYVMAQATAMALYNTLSSKGYEAFKAQITAMVHK